MANHNILQDLNTKLTNKRIPEYFIGITENPEKFISSLGKEKNKDAFLSKFLCLKQDGEAPSYWKEIQEYGDLKYFFAFVSFILLNKSLLLRFMESSHDELKGDFFFKKQGIEEGNIKTVFKYSVSHTLFMAEPKNASIPYDFSHALHVPEVGKLIKRLLVDRISILRPDVKHLNEEEQYQFFADEKLNDVFGLPLDKFFEWLKGEIKGRYVKDLLVKDFFCIQKAELNFENSKEVYLLGENGDGKTLLLDALYLAFNGNLINGYDNDEVGAAQKMLKSAKALQGKDNKGAVYMPHYKSSLKNFFAYGTHRGRCNGTESAYEKNGFMTLFDVDKTLIHPSVWIKNVCWDDMVNSGSNSAFMDFDGHKLPNGIITDKLKTIQHIFDVILDKRVEVFFDKDDHNEVKYRENGGIVKFEVLSEGYRSIIIFVCDLLSRLYNQNIDKVSEQGFNAQGVVLIDEIDAHLHPRWQRTIVGRLRKLFPRMQFIMTTHSPHIIQGASSDAIIYRVYRENGATCVNETPFYRKSLDYMMINTLTTSPLFGMNDARLRNDDSSEYTSQEYLIYRIERKVREKIKEAQIMHYISEAEIDDIISQVYSDIESHE